MFTGIVEEIGTVEGINQSGESILLQIQASFAPDLKLGESVAVNGTCLTVEANEAGVFQAQVMPQTFRYTNLRFLQKGSRVNLERALRLDSRFGGHLVLGHVDGVGKVLRISPQGNAVIFWFSASWDVAQYLIPKGSIAVDGTSLTVAEIRGDSFAVSLIPHTRSATILGERKVGELVNLEADMLGKYVKKYMEQEEPGLSKDKLARFGFA